MITRQPIFRVKARIALLVLFSFILVPLTAAPAFAADAKGSAAADPTAAQYGDTLGQTDDNVDRGNGGGAGDNGDNAVRGDSAEGLGGGGEGGEGGGDVAGAQASSGSALAFTGFDVAILALVGLAVMGAGITLRRMSRIRRSTV